MPHPSRHVWYYCGLLSRHLRPDRPGPPTTIVRIIQLVQVRFPLSAPHPGSTSADTLTSGFMHLACGLSVGLTGLAAGYCIGVVGDKGVRSYMSQSRVFVGMVLILIFGEVLGLYGLEPSHSPNSSLNTANMNNPIQPHRRAHLEHQEQGLNHSRRNLAVFTERSVLKVYVYQKWKPQREGCVSSVQ